VCFVLNTHKNAYFHRIEFTNKIMLLKTLKLALKVLMLARGTVDEISRVRDTDRIK
jgi:hypothetical protein